MIVSFGNTETEKIWNGEVSRRYSIQIQNVVRRKLRMINNAQGINDLRIPPANHLEKLKGDLEGWYSIRVNRQWRLIFTWQNNSAHQVELVDYH